MIFPGSDNLDFCWHFLLFILVNEIASHILRAAWDTKFINLQENIKYK